MIRKIIHKNTIQNLVLILFLLFTSNLIAQQDLTPQEIKDKMSQIREDTDWSDPVASKKANEEIKKLSKQLMMSRVNKNPTNQTDSMNAEIQKENIDAKSKLWNQIMESAKLGENADILLGKPIREEIVEEFKNDESPIIKNPEYYEEMNLLVIDMSLKTVQRTIDQMDKFKSIKTLVITGGKFGSAVNLDDLLKRAKNYPLEELHIINFGIFVNSIPKQIKQFKNLKLLSVLNNNVNSLPTEVGTLLSLQTLFVDINPISTLLPTVGKLKKLKKLGVGKTDIGESELAQIKQLLPNCEVLLQ
jgi:Leucine-rich repeat (LRR) protein